MDTICEARRRDGQPCTGKALAGERHCFAHSEKLRATRRAGNAAGGRHKRTDHRARKLLPEDMRPIFYSVLQDMAAVKNGTLDPRRGSAIASLANAAVRIYEIGLLEQRVRDLEARSDERRWVS